MAKDVPPYMIVEGSPARIRGHNHVQMTRRSMTPAAIDAVRTAYRRLFCEAGATMTTRIAELRAEFPETPQVDELCAALLASASGVHGRALERLRSDDKHSVPAMWQPQSANDS